MQGARQHCAAQAPGDLGIGLGANGRNTAEPTRPHAALDLRQAMAATGRSRRRADEGASVCRRRSPGPPRDEDHRGPGDGEQAGGHGSTLESRRIQSAPAPSSTRPRARNVRPGADRKKSARCEGRW